MHAFETISDDSSTRHRPRLDPDKEIAAFTDVIRHFKAVPASPLRIYYVGSSIIARYEEELVGGILEMSFSHHDLPPRNRVVFSSRKVPRAEILEAFRAQGFEIAIQEGRQ